MAGEIEEPFRFNFQADLLNSGSVSFGRFESESLSWERRSSFSHNRYLEEVEKYSKPGSVTEKKAYFEAHFKRKALLKQSSSECQDDPHDLEESKNVCFDESPHSSDHSKHDEETEVQKYEQENVERLHDYAENGNESGTEHFKLEDAHHSGTENGILVKSEEDSRDKLNDTVLMVDLASKGNDLSVASHTANKEDHSANARTQKMFSPKVRPTSEIKRSKLKLNDQMAQIQRPISTGASNGSAKAKTKENERLLRKEKDRKSPRPATPITRSGRKASKSEESTLTFAKAKIFPPKKSIVNESRSEKTVEAKSSASKKSLPGANQTATRAKQAISPSKPHINRSAAGFNLKSDQRAERRKEVISTFKTRDKPRTPSTGPSRPRPGSSTSSTNRTRPTEPLRKSHGPEKRVQENRKDTSLRKLKQPEPTKGPPTRGLGRGSKPGYLAVGLAT